MNKLQVQCEKCKRVSKGNAKCLGILLKLLDIREDIAEAIIELDRAQAINPQDFVDSYEACGEDMTIFIAKCDKALKDAKYVRKHFYNDYQKGMQEFCEG